MEKEASEEGWVEVEVEEEECMVMVVEEGSMATTTMDLIMVAAVALEDVAVTMIGAKGLERIWMDLQAG